ncbi:TVP38/TMEM64 family protein [Desulfonatronum thioautotrophicum]|uniref:TVP38/TMEM64 family protein n=1 Tax=Desulfonatronum thioautotrophicum TaxID=617001 RepID=UPI0005EAF383|nr:VTT domain-containing protein [Desulfonatronum thioautotrophicum]
MGLVLITIVLLGLILMHITPLRSLLAGTELLGQWFMARGVMGMLLYIAGVTLLVCLGVPRLLLCSIGGMAFGFWQGLFLTQAGTVVGFYTIFILVRHAGWNFAFLRKRPSLDAIQHRIGTGGVLSVFGIRMMPLSGFYSTIMMGMLPIRHHHFLVGTFLGTFPQAIPATLIGSGATQETLHTSIAFIIAAVIAFVIIWLCIDAYRKKCTTPTLS